MNTELSPYALDPFGPSANPRAYVACEASERARAILERSLDQGRIAAVMGPPGHGKTLLLRLIGGREQERARVAYVPFCTLAPDELFAVVLNEIGVSRPGPPRDALAAVTRELAPRGGVVILIDDANALPGECAAALAALYQELGDALRIALAAVQGPAAQRVFHAFGSAIDVVLLAGGMSGREARRYVEMRLAYGGARPELVAAFDEATIDALHRASQGVPRRLNHAAEDVVRRATRGSLPRLRERSGVAAPAAPVRPAAIRTPSVDPAVRAAAPPLARVPEPASKRAPSSPPPRCVPAPVSPAPPSRRRAEPPAADDGRGILLPEIFDRVPGEPAGEYRIVRGTALTAPPRAAEPASVRAPARIPETLLVTPASPARPAPQSAPSAVVSPPNLRRRRDAPLPSPHSIEKPPARTGVRLPIRVIGIAGFALGVVLSMTWMIGREPEEPRVIVPVFPPAESKQAPPASPAVEKREGAPAPHREAPAARALSPAPAPVPIPAPPAPVRVSINATPWAIVSVDGREIGETPLAGIELEPGRHVFSARMPDGTTLQQTVDVSAQRATVVFR